MSATLRVEDFTGNGQLFAQDPPNVVRVAGRTFPVTIHHSKVTELDDYEKVAFQKVCKIHRKLPQGGILVFLTGKQEIVRMVKRLRKALVPKSQRRLESNGDADVDIQVDGGVDSSMGPRDMDDDEADGDLFQNVDHDDFDDAEEFEHDDVDEVAEASNGQDDEDDKRPTKVKIVPLYSLLSVKDQAKVFEPVEEGTRLIVVATNIAETSLTIPGMSYVVDTGRQKCRNYHAGTGVASYDIMWISKASADQRAGRAGRTGPGHCYRTYSSSVYSRHLDAFALPEVLTRPLEDVVLAMKSMNISNVAGFPFPTPPDRSQINAAVQLLANIGCIDASNVERDGGDGIITKLGAAISQLPMGVRYGKMLLVAAQANVLDYGIVLVSVLSEASPFAYRAEQDDSDDDSNSDSEDSMAGLDDVDKANAIKQERQKRKERSNLWRHDGGDVLAGILATGAYSYAGRGAGGATENLACKRFCEENSLHPVIMQRIQKMRIQLAKLAKQRLGNAKGVAASSGKILSSMPPPKKTEENLLRQVRFHNFRNFVSRYFSYTRFCSFFLEGDHFWTS
jgi:ATP-dependent RNA helicase DHX37/DHR1